MPARPFSARLDATVAERLEARGARVGVSKSALAERYIDEGMRMDDHPGVLFRPGPAGRRAALVSGPDVWEVISTARSGEDRGDEAIIATAGHLSLPVPSVRAALRYYAAFTEEIDGWIRRNEDEADAAEAAWLRERELLG